ncbi:MAG: aminotransferase class I/II-fold pyridoxal phosphate-dependent enzyme [Actinomycetota bacterium]|nr:aminotransferase class I/II-fold pyridoxal phosphate-dependent enzyme [Actinomycetota bacterium]
MPIYQNATYGFRSFDQVEAWRAGVPHFLYASESNPTVRTFELKLADLEGAEDAVATATGMAAISTVLICLAAGGHLVASHDVYAGTREFLTQDLPAFGTAVTLVDFADTAAVEAAITPQTRALFCESFSNPLLRVADVPALSALAARHGIPLVVDNTFLSPALLRPLELGATIVVHSATKYLSGHGNVLGGAISGSEATMAAVRRQLTRLGGTMGAFSAWVLVNGMKTLALRVERHSANAAALATVLADHPAVAVVHYPGLPSHPHHATARRLVAGQFGGMLTFALAGGGPAVGPFLDALTLPTIAVSLGDVSTLIWPVGDGMLRLSVGLEDVTDLTADFGDALAGLKTDAHQ